MVDILHTLIYDMIQYVHDTLNLPDFHRFRMSTAAARAMDHVCTVYTLYICSRKKIAMRGFWLSSSYSFELLFLYRNTMLELKCVMVNRD